MISSKFSFIFAISHRIAFAQRLNQLNGGQVVVTPSKMAICHPRPRLPPPLVLVTVIIR